MAEHAADMGATVRVAPREIHDLVYRAARIAGCDPGTAERIAENVTYAEIHHGAAVRAFCEAIEALDLPASAWATAPDALLAAEVAARTGGRASAAFDSPVPLAAIAVTLRHCLERGVAPIGIHGRDRGDLAVSAVEMRTVDQEVEGAGGALVAGTGRDAHRLGVEVDRLLFSGLEAAAAGFLVAEATLDELDLDG